MVSTKTTLAIVAVMSFYFVATQALNAEKCKFDVSRMTEGDKRGYAECFAQSTGKPFDKEKSKFSDLNAEEKEEMSACLSIKRGIVKADGSYDPKRAKEHFLKLDTDEDTRKAVNSGIDACVAAGGDGKTIWDCVRVVMKKECSM